MTAKNIGLFFLMLFVYCAIFIPLFFLSLLLISLLSSLPFIYRIVSTITFQSPLYIPLLLSSLFAFFICSLIAGHFLAHNVLYVLALVVIIVCIILIVLCIVFDGLPVLYVAQILPALYYVIEGKKKVRNDS